ncbi:MAG TPA: carboxypeptidase-like regulatory domain-containing protein, partial [Thermoanaerobaculia bacterium]|nr:carboxypeptidase-like regulatory domain-containing protein [Thermoanaerobaculia bacterium]
MFRLSLRIGVAASLFVAALPAVATRIDLAVEDARCRELTLRAADREWRAVAPSVDVDATPPFRVELIAPSHCFAAPFLVNAESPQTMRVRAAAELTGSITSRPLPTKLAIRFEDVALDCPVAASGAWSCRVPRAKLDLRVAAEGRAPLYLWDADLTSGRLDVGAIALRDGASVAGWLSAQRRGFDPRHATVRLVPDQYGVDDTSASLRSYSAQANARGFFQFVDVFPSTYAVVVEAEGFSAARRGGIVVEDGREFLLSRDIALREFAHLAVSISPPLAPDGVPWRIRLARNLPYSGMSVPLQNELADANGIWRSKSLQAMRHTLEVLDTNGATFHFEQLQIEPDMAPLNINISALRVKGTVKAGDAPLQTTLRFDSDHAQAEFRSDEKGTFEGILPSD